MFRIITNEFLSNCSNLSRKISRLNRKNDFNIRNDNIYNTIYWIFICIKFVIRYKRYANDTIEIQK